MSDKDRELIRSGIKAATAVAIAYIIFRAPGGNS